MDLSESAEADKCVLFKQDDLFTESFPLMKEIRRQGKMCDVTLKVISILNNYNQRSTNSNCASV